MHVSATSRATFRFTGICIIIIIKLYFSLQEHYNKQQEYECTANILHVLLRCKHAFQH